MNKRKSYTHKYIQKGTQTSGARVLLSVLSESYLRLIVWLSIRKQLSTYLYNLFQCSGKFLFTFLRSFCNCANHYTLSHAPVNSNRSNGTVWQIRSAVTDRRCSVYVCLHVVVHVGRGVFSSVCAVYGGSRHLILSPIHRRITFGCTALLLLWNVCCELQRKAATTAGTIERIETGRQNSAIQFVVTHKTRDTRTAPVGYEFAFLALCLVWSFERILPFFVAVADWSADGAVKISPLQRSDCCGLWNCVSGCDSFAAGYKVNIDPFGSDLRGVPGRWSAQVEKPDCW